MDHLFLASEGDGSFWPTGVIMIIVIVVISSVSWTMYERRVKKGKR
ncbi:hypothetical protein ACIPPM_05980 [Streptomyces sp. NPDC090119]